MFTKHNFDTEYSSGCELTISEPHSEPKNVLDMMYNLKIVEHLCQIKPDVSSKVYIGS